MTAILVAADGADYLRSTLQALAAQTRPPDRLLVVQVGTNPVTSGVIVASAPTEHLRVGARSGFGAAVAAALDVGRSAAGPGDWLWLLASDSAPAPDALEQLLVAVDAAPSVMIAGPKQMQWDAPDYLASYGESMTPFGTAVELAEPELDQAQYDRTSDVLGVAAGGMLVRDSLWDQLGGFDPALRAVDDALDFCVRARLAGHRIQLVPTARIRSAGATGPGWRLIGAAATPGRRARFARDAQLHRRLVYSRAVLLPLHWLSLLPLGVVRAVGQLLRKRPGAAPAELIAAVTTLATCFLRVARARRRLRRTRVTGWAAIEPLRLSWREVRHRRALLRDNGRDPSRRLPVRFFTGGGFTVALVTTVVCLVLGWPFVGASALGGGGLLPLGDLHSLWSSIGWGWHPLGTGFTGPADPFALVLAVLGSLTFWHPSASLVALWVLAPVIAAVGGWLVAARWTRRAGLRVVGSLAWVLAPTLLVALDTGRPAAVLVHLAAPFAFLAANGARRSWTSSAALALLAALLSACAPSLLPLLVVAWVVALLATVLGPDRRRVIRLLPLPLPSLVLIAPVALEQARRGHPLAALADPGVVLPAASAPDLPGLPASLVQLGQLVAGWPVWLGDTWAELSAPTGLTGVAAVAIVLALALPLLLLGAVGLLWPRRVVPFRAGLIGAGALVLAVLDTRLVVAHAGTEAVAIWPGAALSLVWLGVAECAVGGLDRLASGLRLERGARGAGTVRVGRSAFAVGVGVLAVACLAVAGAPLLVAALVGASPVRAGAATTAPALVAAEASRRPSIGLLTLTGHPDGGVGQQLSRGGGRTLEQLTTLQTTGSVTDDATVARVAAALVQPSGEDLRAGLAALGVQYVLVRPAPDEQSRAVTTQAAAVLGSSDVFAAPSRTPSGTLYRVAAPTASVVVTGPANTASPMGVLVLIVQGLVLVLTLLLALPTGRLATRFRPDAALTAPRGDVLAMRRARAALEHPVPPGPRALPLTAPREVAP